jgi:hypothetical protein
MAVEMKGSSRCGRSWGSAGSSPEARSVDPTTKQPVSNGARNVWVTETALTTALNSAFMASHVALLLSGFGLAILAIGGALRNPENTLNSIFGRRAPKTVGSTPYRRRKTAPLPGGGAPPGCIPTAYARGRRHPSSRRPASATSATAATISTARKPPVRVCARERIDQRDVDIADD